MEKKNQAKKGLPRLFNHPQNRHNAELFYKFLSQSPGGLVLCQVLPEERLKILRFFDKEPLKEHIYSVDMVQPLCGPMQLQQSILEAHKKYGDMKNIFFIYNFESCIYLSKTSAKRFFQKLNLIRDFFMRLDSAFVFFMTEYSIKEMIRYAFDFYDWMATTFIFVPERLVPKGLPIEIREEDEIKYSAPDKKIEYLKKSIEKTTDEKEKSLKLTELADLYYQIGDYDTSLERILEALEIDEKNNDFQHKAQDYYGIGRVFKEKGDYDAALINCQKAKEVFEKIGDIKGISASLHQIGMIYQYKGDYDAALSNFQKAKEVFEKIGDINGVSYILLSIGMIYQERGDYDAALTHYQKSLEIKEKIGDIAGAALSKAQMGTLYLKQNKFETALKLFIQVFLVFAKIGIPYANQAKQSITWVRENLPEDRFNAILKEFNLPPDFLDKMEEE